MTRPTPTATWLRRSVQAGLASLAAIVGVAAFSAAAAAADGNAAPSLTVATSSATTSVSAVGDTIVYGFLVINTGNVVLSDVAVTDMQTAPANQGNLSSISCPVSSLAPQGTETCLASYTVTQADLNNGSVGGSATAQGNPAGTSTPIVSDPSTLSIPVLTTPLLTTQATSSPATLGDAISDTATITGMSGSGLPTGSVAFFVCGPTLAVALCTSTATPVTPATVPSGSESGFISTGTSGSFVPPQVGFYCFAAIFTPSVGSHYSGTTDNQTGTGRPNECVDVVESGGGNGSDPTAATHVVTPGQNVTDAAAVAAASSGGETVPAPDAQVAPTPVLAVTGAGLEAELTSAALMLAFGIAAVTVARRRRGKPARHP